MLLIHPPMAKACEPPAGIAKLAGVLREHGRHCTLLDANLEGQLYLLDRDYSGKDTFSKRALRNKSANIKGLQSLELYKNPARYLKAANELNRLLEIPGKPDIHLSLANYQDKKLSPLRSSDLVQSAAHPEANIFYDYFSSRLDKLLTENNPRMVGFSINYLSQALTSFAMIGHLKERYPQLPIVVGGGLVTSWLSNQAWKNPFNGLVDHLIAGPGEIPLLKLLECEPEHISTTPDYSPLPLADYLAPGLILPFAASSGCYWRKCSFCPEKAECNSYQVQAPLDVLDSIKQLKKATTPSLLHFLDNAISPALLQALVDNPPGLNWYSFARVGPELADQDFCHALRRSGCVMLKLGLESGDQGVLDALQKGIDLDMVSKVLTNLKNAGIATYVYLLFGTPPEARAEARRTMDFTVEHSPAITFLNLAIFNMPLNSPDAEGLALSDFYQGDLSLYTDFAHPKKWGRKEVRHFLDREFKRHPAIAEIIRRDPPFFTSNHAPFFSHNQ
ncbi:MAG: radical SAM protein [Thermodesulfobacteriota bacterium]